MSRLVGPGPIGTAGPTSSIYTTPFPHKPGDVARDKYGNEFLFVDFTGSVSGGILVGITDTNLASPLLGTALLAQRVGVAMTGATSDNAGWVQIYGLHPAVQTFTASDGIVSDSTVGYALEAQTSIGTPSGVLSLIAGTVTDNVNVIFGMWLSPLGTVSDINADVADTAGFPPQVSGSSGPTTGVTATTNGTSMHSGQSYAVFLNYPYVTGQATDQMASNS